jgi:hypothetical protein
MAISINDVFLPIQLGEKKVTQVSKITPQMVTVLSRFSAATENAVRTALFPGADDDGDGGLSGRPDDDDLDGRDDDDTIDMIDRAKNHLDAMADEDSPDASTERLAKAHALLSRALAKRRGKSSPHSVKFV